MAKLPRGIRNNNPLNIRRSKFKWVGKITPGNDSDFEEFDTIEHGIRAAVLIIRKYITKYGINTPQGIIARWAPASENDTKAYVAYVTKNGLLSPRWPLDLSSTLAISRLLWAMACYECGHEFDYNVFYRVVHDTLRTA